MPAHATANNVIASAKRLIDVRQSCRSNSRNALMNVPAWPMPIHQTKLMMANPQPPFSHRAGQDDRADLVRDGGIGMPRRDDRYFGGRLKGLIGHSFLRGT